MDLDAISRLASTSSAPRKARPRWIQPYDVFREYVDLFLDGEADIIDYILFLLIFLYVCILGFLLLTGDSGYRGPVA